MARGRESRREESAEEGGEQEQVTRQSPLEERRALAIQEMRHLASEKATHLYRETVMNALLVFQEMVRSDDRRALENQLELGVAKQIGDKILDKVKDKALSVVKAGLGLGSRINGLLTQSFYIIKGNLERLISAKTKLTGAELLDALVSATYAGMESYASAAEDMIASAPDAVFIDVYRAVNGARQKDPGHLKKVLETRALEKLGFPKTGGSQVHSLAKGLYSEFKAQVRASKPVCEQLDEIQEIISAPAAHERKIDEKARSAEENIGEMGAAIRQDEDDRAQAEAVE